MCVEGTNQHWNPQALPAWLNQTYGDYWKVGAWNKQSCPNCGSYDGCAQCITDPACCKMNGPIFWKQAFFEKKKKIQLTKIGWDDTQCSEQPGNGNWWYCGCLSSCFDATHPANIYKICLTLAKISKSWIKISVLCVWPWGDHKKPACPRKRREILFSRSLC